MGVRVEERGRVSCSKLFMVICLASSLVVIASGCAEEDDSGKPGVADDRGALADAAAAARREQSNARGASPRGDGGAEAPPNATENPAASASAASLGVTVTSVTRVTSRRRRIQLCT